MSRSRTTLGQGLGFALATALTGWFTLLTWGGFADNRGEYLRPLLLLALGLTLMGALLRWLRVPVFVVPLAQLALVGVVLVSLYGGTPAVDPAVDTSAVQQVLTALRDALDTSNQFRAPVPQSAPSLAPLLITCGAVALIMLDLLAGGLGRVPLSGLVLLLVYSVPVTVAAISVPWGVFVLSALGFMVMLFLREDQRFSQWGREITRDGTDEPAAFGARTGSARGNALAMGGAATACAVVVPLLVPTLGLELFGGNGPGGNGGVTIVNPMTDLRRDLLQGPDTDVLTVTTNQPTPEYLRYAVLTNFNGNEWTTGNRSIPDDQVADGSPLPSPQGVASSVKGQSWTATYSASDDFKSRWLPVPTPALEVDAPGVWKYDVTTMDFISGDDEYASGLTYSATGLDLDVTPERLVVAGRAPGPLTSVYTDLPADVPGISRRLAFDVTRSQTTNFGRAVALQDWFRGAGAFTYSLDRAPSGNGSQALEAFLTEGPDGRTGYCEQFASAMAVMARELNIPARVAVGFLRPDQIGPDTFVYSTRDLHSWPELYFEGSGWVRFEPTPGGPNGRTGQPPSYTRGNLPTEAASTDPSAGQSATDQPSQTNPNQPSQGTSSDAAGAGAGSGGGFPWWPVLVTLFVVALVALALLVPRTLRRLRGEARWQSGGPEAAWAELRAGSTDLGLLWPRGISPRATGEVLAEWFAAPSELSIPVRGRDTNPEAVAALDRLVRAVELSRYAVRDDPADPGQLRRDVDACVAALRAGVSERARRRADWFPASLLGDGRRLPRGEVAGMES